MQKITHVDEGKILRDREANATKYEGLISAILSCSVMKRRCLGDIKERNPTDAAIISLSLSSFSDSIN